LFDIPFLFVKIEASAIERGANKIPRCPNGTTGSYGIFYFPNLNET